MSTTPTRVLEERPYRILSEISSVGRNLLTLLCPFCDAHVAAYRWSLAGSGKRCTCGAKFGYYPTTATKEATH